MDWRQAVAEIHLTPALALGLRGLGAYSHLLVIYFLHRASFDPEADLLQRPRGIPDSPEVGVFALRSPRRPNPIGVTVVELLGIDGPVLKVRGLDAVDGTPVLDLKPYVPARDRVEDARAPAWSTRSSSRSSGPGQAPAGGETCGDDLA